MISELRLNFLKLYERNRWAFCTTTKLIETFETSEPYMLSSNPRVTSYQQCVVMDKCLNFFELFFPHLQSEANDLLYRDTVATKYRKEKAKEMLHAEYSTYRLPTNRFLAFCPPKSVICLISISTFLKELLKKLNLNAVETSHWPFLYSKCVICKCKWKYLS